MHFIHKKVITLVLLSILLTNIGLLLWYIFYGYQEFFHSDSAVKVLLAKEIFETGSYFPKNWNYVNEDIWVFFGHTFIVPLLNFFPAGYTVHAISGSIIAILILLGVWFLSGITDASMNKRITIVAIIAGGISGIVAENFYGQVSYGFTFFKICFLIFFAWMYLSLENKYKIYHLIAVCIILILSFYGNPQRAFITYLFPLIFSILYYFNAYRQTRQEYNFFTLKLLGVSIISSILGVILHYIILENVNNVTGVSTLRWVAYDDILLNINFFLKQFLEIMNGLPIENSLILNISGIQSAFRLIVSFMLITLVVHLFININLQKINGITFIAVFTFILFFIIMFLQIATTLPISGQSSRYIVSPTVLLIILVLVKNYDFKQNIFLFLLSILLSLVLLIQGYTVYYKTDKSLLFDKNVHFIQNPNKLVNFLIENNLKYGYASYWNAARMSVLSDEKVIIRQVQLNVGLPTPMRWLSSDNWYKTKNLNSKTFLLLTNNEDRKFDIDTLSLYDIEVLDVLKYDNLLIYVFDKDLSVVSLPQWSNNYMYTSNFPISRFSSHNIGEYIAEDHTLISNIGEQGALHYGPYINIKPGKYKVTFDIYATSNLGRVAKLDVFSASSKKILAEKYLTASSGTQDLYINLNKEEKLEFRVFSTGKEKIILKGFSLKEE